MATTEELAAAANAAIEASASALADLAKQVVTLQVQQDAANIAVNNQISIITAPNTDIFYLYSDHGVVNVAAANGGIIFPTGTTLERPVNPQSGTVRYNSNSSSLEIYTNAWQAVGTGAGGGSGSGGGATGGVFYENSNTISSSFTSTPGKQVYSAGTLTLSDPTVTVTIANGSIWTVI
jgi:hypothetical protein